MRAARFPLRLQRWRYPRFCLSRYRTLGAVLAAVVIPTGLGLWLSSPGATPNLRPLADLEADPPPHGLAVVQPPAVETDDIQLIPIAAGRTVEVKKGDTLIKLLIEAGISRQDAHAAISALKDVYSPRELKPGQAIRLALAPDGHDQPAGRSRPPMRLVSLSLEPSVERAVRVVRDGDAEGFKVATIDRPLTRELVTGSGIIESSLFVAGRQAGVPTPVMLELIRVFSYDVDFQREVHKADDFELLYESHYDKNGVLAKTGAVIYAALTLSGRRLELYRFTPQSGITDYFAPNGESVRKALLRTPIDGARISSGYGMRRHPILGYSKMHQGVDFAAPRGTPVYAAGDGVVARVGRWGAYGNYIRLRHNGTYSTAYAHLHRFAKGLRKGSKVGQGEVIGYVGSTGRSSGPHLHYEVVVTGKQVDPRDVKLPSGEKLRGNDLRAFLAARERIDRLRATPSEPAQIAQACTASAPGGEAASGEAASAASAERGC